MMNRLLSSLRRPAVLPLLLAALVLAVLPGCEDEQLLEPEEADAGALFNSYVALGNSITAGYMSGGINANTQREAYPVLLAQKMGTEENFGLPLLTTPGCPPPLTQIFPAPRRAYDVDGDGAQENLDDGFCRARAPAVPSTVNNVAVPGAEVIDATSNLDPASNANPLTTFILGGRTQLEAALDADPTFASVWIGNNDVLGAALLGNPALITDGAAFAERYTDLLDGLQEADNLQGALLIGVANVTAIPALSPGAAYYQAIPKAQQAQAAPPNLQVADTCVPSAAGTVLIPFQYGATLLQIATTAAEMAAQQGQQPPVFTIDCAQDRTVLETVGAAFGGAGNIPPAIEAALAEAGTGSVSLLSTQEIVQISQAVEAFNTVIENQAEARGFAYLNPNLLFTSEAYQAQVPVFPELIDDPTNEFSRDEPFGPLFSLDGVHPSARAHQIVAQTVAAAINEEYGTSLPVDADLLPSTSN